MAAPSRSSSRVPPSISCGSSTSCVSARPCRSSPRSPRRPLPPAPLSAAPTSQPAGASRRAARIPRDPSEIPPPVCSRRSYARPRGRRGRPPRWSRASLGRGSPSREPCMGFAMPATRAFRHKALALADARSLVLHVRDVLDGCARVLERCVDRRELDERHHFGGASRLRGLCRNDEGEVPVECFYGRLPVEQQHDEGRIEELAARKSTRTCRRRAAAASKASLTSSA